MVDAATAVVNAATAVVNAAIAVVDAAIAVPVCLALLVSSSLYHQSL